MGIGQLSAHYWDIMQQCFGDGCLWGVGGVMYRDDRIAEKPKPSAASNTWIELGDLSRIAMFPVQSRSRVEVVDNGVARLRRVWNRIHLEIQQALRVKTTILSGYSIIL